MTTNKERIAAYCRVSTDKEEQISSLKAQQEFFEEYAKRANCQLVKLYTDEGKSGTKFKNRPAFCRMMEDAERGLFDCVYVKDVSRLSRNVVDFLQSIRTLKALGVGCRFITANMALSDGELTLTILAAVAQEESANLSKRVKFGKQKNAQKGKVPNFVFGYDKAPNDCFHLTINPTEADKVRQIFSWYLSGLGTYKIACLLNEQGTKTKRGCYFSAGSVLRILKNRIYIGDIINGKEEVCDFLTSRRAKLSPENWCVTKNHVPPIMTEETFLKVQELIRQKSTPDEFHFTKRANHLFSSLIICPTCHYPFRLISRTKNTWVCRGRNQFGVAFCQNNIVLDETELFSVIAHHLKKQLGDERIFIEKLKAEVTRLEKSNQKEADPIALNRQKKQLLKKRQKNLELFEEDILPINELKDILQTIDLELKNIENHKQNCRPNAPDFPADFWQIENLFSTNIMDYAFLKKCIHTITPTFDQITIEFSANIV